MQKGELTGRPKAGCDGFEIASRELQQQWRGLVEPPVVLHIPPRTKYGYYLCELLNDTAKTKLLMPQSACSKEIKEMIYEYENSDKGYNWKNWLFGRC